MEALLIRRAGLADIDAVIDLLDMQFDDHDISVSRENLRETVRVMIEEQDRGLIFLALRDGKAVGVAAMPITWSLEHGGKSIWLDELFVRPECRGTGIGKALLDRAEFEARELGCQAIDLEVDAEHGRAESLYERAGFGRHRRNRFFKRLSE